MANPCILVKQREAVDLLSGDALESQTAAAGSCSYAVQATGASLFIAARSDVSRQTFDLQNSSQGTTASGIGDAAYVDQTKGSVIFLKGSTQVTLGLSFFGPGNSPTNPPSAAVDKLLTLARTVAGRV